MDKKIQGFIQVMVVSVNRFVLTNDVLETKVERGYANCYVTCIALLIMFSLSVIYVVHVFTMKGTINIVHDM